MRILIVEDNSIEAEMLAFSLEQIGYDVVVASNGLDAIEILENEQIRLIISDWEMPDFDGVELCQWVRKTRTAGYVYFMMLTGRSSSEDVVAGLEAGADDFISKPFNAQELFVRLRAGERVLASASRDVTIFSLAKLAESRDPETGAHLERIREYSRLLAKHLRNHPDFSDTIDSAFIEMIYQTSPLHDIGKVGIPDHVLLKPGKLTAEEFEIMKDHTLIGAETLDAAAESYPGASFLTMARDIALTHHEKFDGNGYPLGISGDNIPLCSRIVALADVYDALTSKRKYKAAFSHEKSKSIIMEGVGSHFDPRVVEAFIETEEEFKTIRERLSPEEELEQKEIDRQKFFALCTAQ